MEGGIERVQKNDQESARGHMEHICERGRWDNDLEAQRVYRHKPDNNLHPYTQRNSNIKRTKSGNIQSDILPPTPTCRLKRHTNSKLPHVSTVTPSNHAIASQNSNRKTLPEEGTWTRRNPKPHPPKMLRRDRRPLTPISTRKL